jgi:excisionase family DNA binding protein
MHDVRDKTQTRESYMLQTDRAALAAALTDIAECLAAAAAAASAPDTRGQYTVAEVAAAARVHRGTAWRWIKEGRLAATRVGLRRYCVKELDLLQMLSTEN